MYFNGSSFVAICVEGQLITISAKSISILTTGFGGEDVKVSYIGTYEKLATPPDDHVFDGQIRFCYF